MLICCFDLWTVILLMCVKRCSESVKELLLWCSGEMIAQLLAVS